MKRILITGLNSYIGNSLDEWLSKSPEMYSVDKMSMRDINWDVVDFSGYDSIVHVAGIAHVSKDDSQADLYYQVNTNLTIDVAQKAKEQGVNQFIFLSSIIVYGEVKDKNGIITKDTIPKPVDYYGESKLLAEEGLHRLQSDTFRIAIIRPPMIYGKGSKGNYPRLAKLAKTTPIFPNYTNQRSMLHIDNLTEFIRLVISNEDYGTFYPQNKEYVCTTEMVHQISLVHNKKILRTKVFNFVIKGLSSIDIVKKVFGNLVYDHELSKYKSDYRVVDFPMSIEKTENVKN